MTIRVIIDGKECVMEIPQTAFENALLTKQEVMKRYKICLRTVDEWCKKREMPHFKQGGIVRFQMLALEMWEARYTQHNPKLPRLRY
jgi:hypothetical protein